MNHGSLSKTSRALAMTARILVVEDHDLLRDGLRRLIHSQANWEVCGEAKGEGDALKQFREADADLVIVDLTLRQGNGLNLVKRLREIDPAVRILVVSMHDEALYADRALRAGADGFVSKQCPNEQVLDAIRTVLQGDVYVSQQVVSEILFRAVGKYGIQRRPAVDQLSNRELEILLLIGQGVTTDQIAGRLHLSANTIGTYRDRLKRKLRVRSGAELCVLAANWLALSNEAAARHEPAVTIGTVADAAPG